MSIDGHTLHARRRAQQRAIPPYAMDLLNEFGSEHRSKGATHLVFDSQARKRIKQIVGGKRGMRMIEPWLDLYMIISDDGNIITVGHRYKRINRL